MKWYKTFVSSDSIYLEKDMKHPMRHYFEYTEVDSLDVARYLDDKLEDANYHTECGMYEALYDTFVEYGLDEDTRLNIFNHFVEIGGLIHV